MHQLVRAIPVAFSPGRGGFVANGALLPGAHATVARLVSNARAPASAPNSAAGMAGKAVGARVHQQLEHFYRGRGVAPGEHVLAAKLREALRPHLAGASLHPELAVAEPGLGFATSADLVACARDRVLVVEYKTGYLATFDTASAGRWARGVAAAMKAACIDCTPGGRATAQAFLGALAFAKTFGVPPGKITVVVARAWAVGTHVCTSICAYPLASPAYGRVADAMASALAKPPGRPGHSPDGRRPGGRARKGGRGGGAERVRVRAVRGPKRAVEPRR